MKMDEFQIVHHGRRKGGRKNCQQHNQKRKKKLITNNYSPDDEIDVDKCTKQIEDIRCEMKNCKFWKEFQVYMLKTLDDSETIWKELVLYGIGSIGNSSIARHQLVLVLLLVEQLKINAFFYDPVMTNDEKGLMEKLGLKSILVNEECKRSVTKPTIFIMFHCGKAMYNNLLWSNWKQLQNICIVGNTFTSYLERTPSRILEQVSPYVKNIIPFTDETIIENTYELDDVFNDSSIHTFPLKLLHKAEPSLWELTSEPTRNEDDVEIITRKEEGD